MNLTVYPLLALLTLLGIVLFPLGFLLWRLLTAWSARRITRHFVWLYGQGWRWIVSPFVHFRLEGLEKASLRQPCIMVVNHLSYFDTYCMAALPFHNAAFAVRSWPFKMIWYSAFMHLARYLNVEGTDWSVVAEQASRELADGGCLVFFPEGHRSRDGKMRRFHSGAFKLAIDTGVPLVPLCVAGTDVLLPPGSFRLHPARVHLRALPAIDPRQFPEMLGHLHMRKTVREMMARNVAEMTAANV
ncbi:MAG: glycerol acyltransferase [Lentisphaerae bacterium RIFOXYB12_FULL_65_16]|nr:MAG: glycerol acyltransferase [Lentisphaerae bacterium RIFOXYA12_64_32]OGV90089.1 MAG: glycerol acyltransferase [Lentisphaerae bacterium RIFOXYB12_FULL_65_16]